MQEEPALRNINIQEAFDMPLASRSHHIWLELTVWLCLIAEARCVWCTYVLLLLDHGIQILQVQSGGFFMIFHDYHYPFFTVCGDCIGTISCWISPMFELRAWFVVGFIMCHSKFLLMFSKSGPCNHHNIIITISQAFLRWTLVVLPYSSAHLLPHVGGNPVSWSNRICLLGNSRYLLLKSPFPKNSWMVFIQIVNWNINPTILADSITISQPPTIQVWRFGARGPPGQSGSVGATAADGAAGQFVRETEREREGSMVYPIWVWVNTY